MKVSELFETLKLSSHSSEKAKAWIKKVEGEYPRNPMNGDQLAMVFDGGKAMAMFELEPSRMKPDAVEVKWFQAYPLRGGYGTKAMQKLQDQAKKDGIHLTLFPWDKGRLSQAALMKFYKKLGFKPMSKGSKNMHWSPEDHHEGK